MNSSYDNCQNISFLKGIIALSPIIIFLTLYLVVSLTARDFYSMPLTVAMLAGAVWGITIIKKKSLAEKVGVFTRSASNTDVIYMICVFIMAGSFASLATYIGAVDATVELTLKICPPNFLVAGLFIAACFISLSIGTSVGTVVALTPLAMEIATTTGASIPFYVAAVLGGSFFGDNLSFISDTTIAATRTQDCKMNEKFKANLWIVVPAAILTLILYVLKDNSLPEFISTSSTNPWLVIPYLSIIVLALCGLNVQVVLLCGIIVGLFAGFFAHFPLREMVIQLGNGIDSMGNLIIITFLATGMLGLVKEMGGISFLLQTMSLRIRNGRGAQACVAILTGIVNLCTANNTIAIITVGSICRDISLRFGISPRRTASLLDTSSCIVQCLIPYGAQTLLATSIAGITPLAPFEYLYYPWILSGIVVISIIIRSK